MILFTSSPQVKSFAFFLVLFLLTSHPVISAKNSRISADTRISMGWEYDNNVLEESSDKHTGGAGKVSLFSKLRLRYPRSLTMIYLQSGYKGHHSFDSEDEFTAGNILVTKLAVDSERLLEQGWSAGFGGEIKHKKIYQRNELNLLSEEGYIRGSGRLFTRKQLRGLGKLSLSYQYSFFDFETFKSFNYHSHSPGIKFSHQFSRNFSGDVLYSFNHRKYQRKINARDPQGIIVQLDQDQRDKMQQVVFTATYSTSRLISFSWFIQRNSSNNYGFSYWNNRFSLLLADKLPWDMFLNAYLFFELKRYSDKVDEPILLEVITEENDNNGAIVKITRPINDRFEVDCTASLYRNESSIRELNFNKNLLSFSLTCRF